MMRAAAAALAAAAAAVLLLLLPGWGTTPAQAFSAAPLAAPRASPRASPGALPRAAPHAAPPANSWTFTEGQQAALRGLRHDGKAALRDEDASRHVATLLDKMEKQLASAAFQRAALGALASAVSTSESTRRALAGLDAVRIEQFDTILH